MVQILETERLILRQFELTDAPFMFALANEPAWLKYIGDRKIYSVEAAESYIRNGSMKSYADHGFGFYVVVLKDGMIPIGTCGLAQRDFLKVPDFGFLAAYRGKGYAFEVASANLTYARTVLKIRELVAITLPSNEKSIRLLEKLGFAFSETYLEDKEELSLYRLP